MRTFLKTSLIFSVPLIVIIIAYIIADPFKVVRKYDLYLSDCVMLNRGFVSTQVFLKNNERYNFDSFIFGSSRATAFTCNDWRNYLPTYSVPFSFGAWNETIEGIYAKILFIAAQGNKIENVLILVDVDQTFIANADALEKEHYDISGIGFWKFHKMYFIQSLREYYLIPASIDYKLFNKRRTYMKNFVGMKIGDLDPINNDWKPFEETEICKDSVTYYSGSIGKFYRRSENEAMSVRLIDSTYQQRLQKIDSIFDQHGTQVKIVIAPLYNQVRINEFDLETLKFIFKGENVYNYSGINPITNNMYNYRNDVSHIRIRTANRILREVYSNN